MPKAKKKAPAKTSKATHSSKKPRKLKADKYKSFRLHKRIKSTQPKLSSAFKLFKTSLGILKDNWKLFLGLSIIYGLLMLIFVRGFSSSTNLTDVKDVIKDSFSGRFSGLATSAVLFSYLIGSGTGSSTEAGNAYQALFIITASLATIWALRQVLAGHKIRIRDAYYKGLYPLAQFVLILAVVGLQLIPLVIGSWIYGTVTANGIANSGFEKAVWLITFILLATLSLYMICSSIFALYIVTLPDMTPMKALRSARQLVLHRRWKILKKILFLPLVLLVIGAAIFMPLVIIIPAAVQWIFFALSALLVVIVHSYMYTLYRELL